MVQKGCALVPTVAPPSEVAEASLQLAASFWTKIVSPSVAQCPSVKQTAGPTPAQSESGPQATHVFEIGLQMGVVGVPLQLAFVRQPTQLPFNGLAAASVFGTHSGVATSKSLQAVAPSS
jgi:hypothetical protein